MKLDLHIAKRFLTDDTMKGEIIQYMFPDFLDKWEKKEGVVSQIRNSSSTNPTLLEEDEAKGRVTSLFCLLNTPKNHKPYYCTETMIECLELLKINKEGEHYNWTYFDKLPNQTATFIFPTNALLRMQIVDETISFIHVGYQPYDKERGNMKWVMFYLNRKTGELCEHFAHPDVKGIEKFIYSLLCFVYMADNEEIIVPAGTRYGTKKSGKLINSTPFEVTIINSKWNVTSIRNEKFTVSPHFAIRHTGPGRTIPRVVFINQFEKQGYVRKNKPENLQL